MAFITIFMIAVNSLHSKEIEKKSKDPVFIGLNGGTGLCTGENCEDIDDFRFWGAFLQINMIENFYLGLNFRNQFYVLKDRELYSISGGILYSYYFPVEKNLFLGASGWTGVTEYTADFIFDRMNTVKNKQFIYTGGGAELAVGLNSTNSILLGLFGGFSLNLVDFTQYKERFHFHDIFSGVSLKVNLNN